MARSGFAAEETDLRGSSETTHRRPESPWLVTCLLLTARSGETQVATTFAGDLVGRQNDDGGWGFLAGDPSDAMPTGEALYALSIQPDGQLEVASRGVAFLLSQQKGEGSWTILSRLFSTEASTRHDYIYDVWGTAWAAIGLSRVSHRYPTTPSPSTTER